MSQRNKIFKLDDDRWHASEYRNTWERGNFGGIFPQRGGVFSVILCRSDGSEGPSKVYKKWRPAKKALSKWVNP